MWRLSGGDYRLGLPLCCTHVSTQSAYHLELHSHPRRTTSPRRKLKRSRPIRGIRRAAIKRLTRRHLGPRRDFLPGGIGKRVSASGPLVSGRDGWSGLAGCEDASGCGVVHPGGLAVGVLVLLKSRMRYVLVPWGGMRGVILISQAVFGMGSLTEDAKCAFYRVAAEASCSECELLRIPTRGVSAYCYLNRGMLTWSSASSRIYSFACLVEVQSQQDVTRQRWALLSQQ